MKLARVGIIFALLIALCGFGIQYGYKNYILLECCLKPDGFVLPSNSIPTVDVKRVLCVGGTSGIGYAVATNYLKSDPNVQVLLIGRRQPVIAAEFAARTQFLAADLTKTSVARETADFLQGQHFDVVLFTVGGVPDNFTRTSEGLEFDLAISYLSRHVMLEKLLANGLQNSRVFIMGFAGFPGSPANLQDINWETTPYSFMPAHLNTHIFNEALVHYYAHKIPSVSFYGLAPGWVMSEGFRYQLGSLQTLFEKVVPSPDEYAKDVLIPLFGSPDIKSGWLFNPQGKEVNPGPWFISNPSERGKEIVDLNNALLTRLGLRGESI